MREHLTADDHNFIELRCTPAVVEFFEANAVIFSCGRHVPGEEGRICISKHGSVEQYTLFGGHFAHPMGAFSYNHSPVAALKAGRYCSIGNGLRVFGERHPMEWVTTSNITYCFRPEWNKPHFMRAHADLMGNQWRPLQPPGNDAFADSPALGHDVWIAETVTLARGIKIGTGAVIGVDSVVTKDIETYMVCAGNPARPIRRRFGDALCERLLASRWWELHPNALFAVDARDPERFLDRIAEARETIGPCPVRSFTWKEILHQFQ
jgi:acetyltransferase-like isoleucine patch superfamily enzyme